MANKDVCEWKSGEGRGAEFVSGGRGGGEGGKEAVRGEVFRDELRAGGAKQAGERSEACKEPVGIE